MDKGRGARNTERLQQPAAPGAVQSPGAARVAAPELRDRIMALEAEAEALRAEVAQLRARNVELEHLVNQDPLMPVANRRAFVRELARLISLAQRQYSESSLLYVDMNNMKRINDSYGHAAGDAALVHLVTILNENIRVADVVGRLGGDEFGVLLVGTGILGAEEKAAALETVIAGQPVVWNGTEIAISASFGAYCFSGSERVEEVLAAADLAMYRAKHAHHLESWIELEGSEASESENLDPAGEPDGDA